MANYYTDHPEIAFYFQHPLMRRIVELREKGFADKDLYPEAPVDYEDRTPRAWTWKDRTSRTGG